MLTTKELSAWLNIKPFTLYLWVSQNKIPCCRIHGLIRFDPDAIQAWLNTFSAPKINPPRLTRHDAGDVDHLIAVSMEKELNARDRWLTEDEESRLFAVAVWWVRELVTFAIHTGMRRGEILALAWAGVDFTRRTVTVFQLKNGERRTIPVNQTVLDLLPQKRAQRGGVTRVLEQDFVFVSQSCTPIDSSNLRRRFVSSLKARTDHGSSLP